MKYYSLNDPSHQVSFQETVVNGLAPDGGLYMPEYIPSLPDNFISSLPELSRTEIAFTIARHFVHESFPKDVLRQIVQETIDFDFPLTPVEQNVYSFELYHGPTLAFKDVGARFMARILKYIAQTIGKEITVLVATSGDTGSAVAHGFYEVPGIEVVILYPEGKVSALQEKQLATLGKNIHAVKVTGTFDDCQQLVKTAFQDSDLRKTKFLTSANSINIARLIPQSFYYFFAWSNLPERKHVVFSVPSGNFGNLTAGMIAKRMGLPVDAFIASTNINDVVPQYLKTKVFTPRPSQQTVSNAMDVGNPSNFARLLALYNNDWYVISSDIKGYSFTDEETKSAIQHVHQLNGYILDPHGAVGYLGLKAYQHSHSPCTGVFLETAHPSKFPGVVEASTGQPLEIHSSLLALKNKQVNSETCSADFNDFKALLLGMR